MPVTLVNLKEVARGEYAENAHREDFLPSEIDAIRRALLPLQKAAAKERQRRHSGTAPGRKKQSGQVSRSDTGRVRDKIADFAGISGRTLEKIRAIIDAAERQPRRFGSLVAEMDSHGRIDATYRKLRRMIDEEQRLAVKPLKGKFRTLCIDPPWAYAIGEETIRPVYATMSQKELLALPISSWADDPAHLYLWTRNADLPDAFQLVEAWGFKYLTMLTWVKSGTFL